jgi:putative peptidoglycan lipid II flippase
MLMIRVLGLGHAGLALSTSIVALFGFLVLFEILRRRIGGVYGRELTAGIGKVIAASLIMAAIVALSSHVMERWIGVSQLGRLGDLAVSIPVGLVVFYAACRALGLADIDLALRAFVAPVQRRLTRARR